MIIGEITVNHKKDIRTHKKELRDRAKDKMVLISAFLGKKQRRYIRGEAKTHGISVSQILRHLVAVFQLQDPRQWSLEEMGRITPFTISELDVSYRRGIPLPSLRQNIEGTTENLSAIEAARISRGEK